MIILLLEPNIKVIIQILINAEQIEVPSTKCKTFHLCQEVYGTFTKMRTSDVYQTFYVNIFRWVSLYASMVYWFNGFSLADIHISLLTNKESRQELFFQLISFLKYSYFQKCVKESLCCLMFIQMWWKCWVA